MSNNSNPVIKSGQYLQNKQNLEVDAKRHRRKLRYALIGLTLLACLFAYVCLHRPVILVPYGLDKKVSVSVSRVSPYYLMLLARNDAATYFDVTPQSIDENMSLFLARIAPRYVGQLQIPIKKRSMTIKKADKSSMFFPGEGAVIKGNTVTLKGRLIELISNKIIHNTSRTVTVTYDNINGQLFIKEWT